MLNYIVVDGGEYCDFENFRAQCNQGNVLHILQGTYGHMKLGKCVTTDLGHFGCQSDVTGILAEKCNRKNQCDLDILDEKLRRTNLCDTGLKVYLEAKYACIRGKIPLCLTNEKAAYAHINDACI